MCICHVYCNNCIFDCVPIYLAGEYLVNMDIDTVAMKYFALQPPELIFKTLENFSPEQIFTTCLVHFPQDLAGFAFDKFLLKGMAKIDVRTLHKLFKNCQTKDQKDWCLHPLVKAKVSMRTLTDLVEVTHGDKDADVFIKDINLLENDGVVILRSSTKLPDYMLAP